MVLKKADREELMKISSELNSLHVHDLLPRLDQVLRPADIRRVEYRANTDGWEWAAHDLLMVYQMRAKDLNPMIDALKAIKMDELADKLSNISLASAAASSYKDGDEEFERVMSEIRSYVRDKYLRVYAKLRPLPQVNRIFDIRKIWVNLQLENRTELKDPEDYRACMLSAFEENKLLIITGHQGSGKTTLVRRIAFDWASGNLEKFHLVLVARYRDLEDDADTPIDLALQWMKDKQFLTPEHTVFLQQHKNKLSSKVRLLLLLDGLDQSTVKCATLDKDLGSDDPAPFDYFVLVASRPQVVDETVRCPCPITFILPWNETSITEYIMLHFLQYSKEEGGLPDFKAQQNTVAVLNFLATHPHAENIANIPLHITFICLLQEDGALEPGMSSSLLHRKLCYALVRRQVGLFNAPLYPELLDAFQGEFGRATRCVAVRNLALLAYEALVKGVGVKRVFSSSDLKEKGVDIEMCLKVGFLQTYVSYKHEWAKYEFPHVSLQYYLVADLLLEEFRKEPELEINVKDPRRIAHQEVIDENPILKELEQCTKIVALDPLICYLIEMALVEDGSEKLKVVNSIGAFLLAWNLKRSHYIGAEIITVQLLLKLGKECDGAGKTAVNALASRSIEQHHYNIRSLLLLASDMLVVRVHKCGILFEDINIVVFSSQYTPTHYADVNQLSNSTSTVNLCLIEEDTLEYLAQTCRRMGWKKIVKLRAEFRHNTKFHVPLSCLSTDMAFEKIETIELDFNHPAQSISVAPVLEQILGFASIKVLKLSNASINDLSCALSKQKLSDTIQTVALERISFPIVDDLSGFLRAISSLKCQTKFHQCHLAGSRLIEASLIKVMSQSLPSSAATSAHVDDWQQHNDIQVQDPIPFGTFGISMIFAEYLRRLTGGKKEGLDPLIESFNRLGHLLIWRYLAGDSSVTIEMLKHNTVISKKALKDKLTKDVHDLILSFDPNEMLISLRTILGDDACARIKGAVTYGSRYQMMMLLTEYMNHPEVGDWELFANAAQKCHNESGTEVAVRLVRDNSKTSDLPAEQDTLALGEDNGSLGAPDINTPLIVRSLSDLIDEYLECDDGVQTMQHFLTRNDSKIHYNECLRDCFAECRLIVCSGVKGSGKTSLAKNLQKDCNTGVFTYYDLVLVVDMNDCDKNLGHEDIFEMALAGIKDEEFRNLLRKRLPFISAAPMYSADDMLHLLIVIDNVTDKNSTSCKQLWEIISSRSYYYLPFALLILLEPRYKSIVECSAEFVDIAPLSKSLQDEVIGESLPETLAVSFKRLLDDDQTNLVRDACSNPGFLSSVLQNRMLLNTTESAELKAMEFYKEHVCYCWWQMLLVPRLPWHCWWQMPRYLGKAALRMALAGQELLETIDLGQPPFFDCSCLKKCIDLGLVTEDSRFDIKRAISMKTLQFKSRLLAVFMASYYVHTKLNKKKYRHAGGLSLIGGQSYQAIHKTGANLIDQFLSKQSISVVKLISEGVQHLDVVMKAYEAMETRETEIDETQNSTSRQPETPRPISGHLAAAIFDDDEILV